MICTRVGRVIYNRKKTPFGEKDIHRIVRKFDYHDAEDWVIWQQILDYVLKIIVKSLLSVEIPADLLESTLAQIDLPEEPVAVAEETEVVDTSPGWWEEV